MKQVKVGSQSLLGYLPALVIQNVLNENIKKDSKPPISIEMETVSLFADISGFTKLSEEFSKKGRTGSEFLAFCLNRYMEQLINIIGKNGGDIFKFAGDALLVIWPMDSKASNENFCRRALQCALSIQSKLNNLEMSKGKILSVKVGLGFGKCKVLLVGGKFDRFEYLIVGEAMRQACASECHCKGGGETVVSQDVYSLISQFYEFEEAEPDNEHASDGLKYYKFLGTKTHEKIQVVAGASLMRKKFRYELIKNKYSILKTFVPAAITTYLDIEKEAWCKESRLVTIMFLNLTIDLKHTETEDGLKYIQKIINTVQRCVYRTRGSLNKFLMDDKGSVLLIAWGIPPLSAYDDPIRAVLTGLNIVNELKTIDNDTFGICGARIGITTGCCFSGVCGGSGDRREYSLLGEVVNLSARFMQQSMKVTKKENKKFQILISEKTKNLIQNKIFCKLVCKDKCKGFSNEFNFYEPIEKEENFRLLSCIKTHRNNLDDDNISEEKLTNCMFMTGRDYELKKCLELLNKVSSSNESKLVLIKGIIGSGKSLLVRNILYLFFEQHKELKKELPENKKENFNFLFVTIQLPTTYTTPYNGCCDFLKKIYGTICKKISRTKNITITIGEKYEAKCSQFGKFLLEKSYFNYIKIIDEILGSDMLKEHFSIPEEKYMQVYNLLYQLDDKKIDKYFTSLNLTKYQAELNKFFIDLVNYYRENLIKGKPFILILEDTHLIDDYSISLINELHSFPKTFILCTYQDSINPLLKPKLLTIEYDELIQLKGLQDQSDILSLISNYCKETRDIFVSYIDDDLLFTILDHSFKNNPLFITELIGSLLDQECIMVNSSNILTPSKEFKKCFENLDWSSLNIPFIIEKCVGSIIDSLKCQEIILLKIASVIGAIFDIDKLHKLNVLNNSTFEDLCQLIYKFSKENIVEILYDINPKRFVAKFSIPFLKEILYKRMLVETKNEIHIQVARLMESSKFSYLPRKMETFLLNFHLLEEGKTILDHMDDSKNKEVPILKEANLRIKVLKEATDKLRDIDLKIDEEDDDDSEDEYKSLSKRSMPIVKCGTFEKKSDKGITWEKRFVVATKNKFYFWYTSEDYKENKQYLGMFELKNLYNIKSLKDFQFSDKMNLMEFSVSSHYKKDILKGPRNYIFSAKNKTEMTTWVILLSFLRANGIYDEFRYNFGILNFPLNHEKQFISEKRKSKRKFFVDNKLILENNKLDKNNSSKNKDKKKTSIIKEIEVLVKRREEIENEKISKLKNKIGSLINFSFSYFLGVIQNKIESPNKTDNDVSSSNLNNYLSTPPHYYTVLKSNPKFLKLETKEKIEPLLNEENLSKDEIKNIIVSKQNSDNNLINSLNNNNLNNLNNNEISTNELLNALNSKTPPYKVNDSNNITNNILTNNDKRNSNPENKVRLFFKDLNDSNIISNNTNSNINILTDENLIKHEYFNDNNNNNNNNMIYNQNIFNMNNEITNKEAHNSINETKNKLLSMNNIDLGNDALEEQIKQILSEEN